MRRSHFASREEAEWVYIGPVCMFGKIKVHKEKPALFAAGFLYVRWGPCRYESVMDATVPFSPSSSFVLTPLCICGPSVTHWPDIPSIICQFGTVSEVILSSDSITQWA